MELDSKKVLPSGAVVLIMHGMEFNNGNQVALPGKYSARLTVEK